jgi:hypothetical protein
LQRRRGRENNKRIGVKKKKTLRKRIKVVEKKKKRV